MSSLSRNQQFAAVSAVIYLSACVLGFLVTGFDDFAADTDEKLIILGLNPLHNLVHLTLGAVWAAAATSRKAAPIANLALGAGLLAAFGLGVAGGAGFLNIDGVSEPDNYLHLVYGIAAIAIARTEPAPRTAGVAV